MIIINNREFYCSNAVLNSSSAVAQLIVFLAFRKMKKQSTELSIERQIVMKYSGSAVFRFNAVRIGK